MKRNSDPLAVTPHWHVDVRLEAELPEDNIVGTRFLANVLCTALLAAGLLYVGYLGYLSMSLQHQIDDWGKRMDDHRAEAKEIQHLQREYAAEAAKIDQAYALVRPQFHVSAFIAEIGRTRPPQLLIDLIQWNDAGVVVRGIIHEPSKQASEVLRDYVDQLKRHDKIAPLFREIVLTDIDRGTRGDSLRFEIIFRLKPTKV